MKSKIYRSIVVLALLVIAYKLGYQSGYHHARHGVQIVEVDSMDAPTQSLVKSEYEPYFSQRNQIPAKIK